MNKTHEQIQQLSSDTVGKISVGIGGGGTTAQILTEWTNIFVLSGNALLVAGGLYLMTIKLLDRRKQRKGSG